MSPVHLRTQLRIVQARLAFAVSDAVKAKGITPHMHAMLDAIGRLPGIRPSALADILVTSEPNVSRTLRALDQRGLVDRRSDPADRRAVGLHVNARSERLMRQIEERSMAAGDNCLSILDDAEREMFCAVLAKLSDDYFRLGSAHLQGARESVKRYFGALYGDASDKRQDGERTELDKAKKPDLDTYKI